MSNPYFDVTNSDLFDRKEYAQYKGSPFLSENPESGYVIFKNGDKTNFEKLNLDFYKNLIITETKGKEVTLLNKFVDKVYIKSKGLGLRSFKITDDNEKVFFYELLVDDNVKLLKFLDVQLVIEDRQNATSYSGNTNVNQKRFVVKESLYWTLDYKEFSLVPESKSELLETFKSVDTLESFLKENKLKPKKAEDLIEIFQYLNYKGI